MAQLRPSVKTLAEALTDLIGSGVWTPTADWVEAVLARPCRCRSCGRELHALVSVLAGEGPVCRAKRGRR
jgi:hypothetical protein